MLRDAIALPRMGLTVPRVVLGGFEDTEAPTRVLRFAEQRIVWTFEAEPRLKPPGPAMLSEFLDLASVSDGRLTRSVERLASTYGALSTAVCRRDHHNKSARGPLVADPDPPYGIRHSHAPLTDDRCRAYAADGGPLTLANIGWEPVMAWRLLAERLAAVIEVSRSLSAGNVGDRTKWAVITGKAKARGETFPLPESVDHGRELVHDAVRDLFRAGSVRLLLGYEAEPVLQLAGDGLLGALAVQVALRVGGAEAVAVCAECGAVVPDRLPDSRRAFCQKHRTPQITNRWAARDARRRRKGETP